jgi:hypothetical protein
MRGNSCLPVACLLFAATASAQFIPAGQKVGLAAFLQGGYGGLKMNLTQAAEKMPEADYASKPSSMAEVRTYGQIFGHVADAQFFQCATARGVPNPNQGKSIEREAKTKAEIVKGLADSFAFSDPAFASLTDASAMELVKQGEGEIARSAVLVGVVAHGSEMYGICTVYLRAKNLVPPSTEMMQQMRGRRGGQ